MLVRDLKLAFRQLSDLANPVLFFLVVVSLFPFGVGPSLETLRQIGPGIIWVSALLATLLALEGLFRPDFDDGTLEQLLLSPHPLAFVITAKLVAHWLTCGLPLILLSPFLASLMNIPVFAFDTMVISLLLGTPTLSLLGAVGMALTVSLKRGGLLVALLVLPLYIPVLIFGAGAVQAAILDLNTSGQLYFLAAMLALSITLAPIAVASALRIGSD